MLAKSLKRMVGVTGIEPVTPTMSTNFPPQKPREIVASKRTFQAHVAKAFTVFWFSEPEGTTLMATPSPSSTRKATA